MPLIHTGVGRGELNNHSDVKIVQQLINLNIHRLNPMEALTEDGYFGWKTQHAIGRFQRAVMMLQAGKATGKVGPGDDTYNALCWGSQNPKFSPQPGQKGDFRTQGEFNQAINGKKTTQNQGSSRGVNPITGTSGFDPEPVGTVGHLRESQGGKGEFNAHRNHGNGHHRGLDIRGIENQTPIYANRAGTVTFRAPKGIGGNTIIINHGDVTTAYCHCSNLDFHKWVKAGDTVTPGQRIATVGRTGNAGGTPPHVHFGVFYKGHPINPAQYLNGVPLDQCDTLK